MAYNRTEHSKQLTERILSENKRETVENWNWELDPWATSARASQAKVGAQQAQQEYQDIQRSPKTLATKYIGKPLNFAAQNPGAATENTSEFLVGGLHKTAEMFAENSIKRRQAQSYVDRAEKYHKMAMEADTPEERQRWFQQEREYRQEAASSYGEAAEAIPTGGEAVGLAGEALLDTVGLAGGALVKGASWGTKSLGKLRSATMGLMSNKAVQKGAPQLLRSFIQTGKAGKAVNKLKNPLTRDLAETRAGQVAGRIAEDVTGFGEIGSVAEASGKEGLKKALFESTERSLGQGVSYGVLGTMQQENSDFSDYVTNAALGSAANLVLDGGTSILAAGASKIGKRMKNTKLRDVSGDFDTSKISFDTSNPQEMLRAQRVLDDYNKLADQDVNGEGVNIPPGSEQQFSDAYNKYLKPVADDTKDGHTVELADVERAVADAKSELEQNGQKIQEIKTAATPAIDDMKEKMADETKAVSDADVQNANEEAKKTSGENAYSDVTGNTEAEHESILQTEAREINAISETQQTNNAVASVDGETMYIGNLYKGENIPEVGNVYSNTATANTQSAKQVKFQKPRIYQTFAEFEEDLNQRTDDLPQEMVEARKSKSKFPERDAKLRTFKLQLEDEGFDGVVIKSPNETAQTKSQDTPSGVIEQPDGDIQVIPLDEKRSVQNYNDKDFERSYESEAGYEPSDKMSETTLSEKLRKAGITEDPVYYEELANSETFDTAAKMWEQEPDRAFDIATGRKSAKDGELQSMVAIVGMKRAEQNGDWQTKTDIANFSFREASKKGQEIQAWNNISVVSTEKLMKDLQSRRRNGTGNKRNVKKDPAKEAQNIKENVKNQVKFKGADIDAIIDGVSC